MYDRLNSSCPKVFMNVGQYICLCHDILCTREKHLCLNVSWCIYLFAFQLVPVHRGTSEAGSGGESSPCTFQHLVPWILAEKCYHYNWLLIMLYLHECCEHLVRQKKDNQDGFLFDASFCRDKQNPTTDMNQKRCSYVCSCLLDVWAQCIICMRCNLFYYCFIALAFFFWPLGGDSYTIQCSSGELVRCGT